jgi:succinate-acetate transporter protein
MAFAVIAWYHALAGLVADTFGKKLMPVGHIGPLTLESEGVLR